MFGVSPEIEEVFTEGISKITKDDFDWASRLDKTIKRSRKLNWLKKYGKLQRQPRLVSLN